MRKNQILLFLILIANTATAQFLGVDPHQEFQSSGRSAFSCDTTTNFTANSMPGGLAWDGQYLWYADTVNIYKVSTTGSLLNTFPNPSLSTTTLKGGDLCFAGTSLWYADEQSAQLYKLDTITGSIIQQFNLPSYGLSNPNGFGLAWDGSNLWHSQYNPQKIFKLNPLDGQALDSMLVGASILGVEYISGYLYGTSPFTSRIYKIDTLTGNFIDSASWCVPYSLGLTWDGTSFWNISGEPFVFGTPTGGKRKIYGVDSDIVASITDHLEEVDLISVYPNPTNGTFWISAKKPLQDCSIYLYDILGNLVLKKIIKGGEQIDITSQSKGLYLLKLFTDKTVLIKRIVLN